MPVSAPTPWIVAGALLLEGAVGWPRHLPHPVVGIGGLITSLERRWNQPEGPQNYYDVVRREQEAAKGPAPSSAAPAPVAPPPPKKEPAEDLSGLY